MQPEQIISIIVAVADDWAIGRDGDMPWHISEDMKFFKAKTMGGSLIMGRRTWESIGCKPLPGRENIVVSSRLAAEGLGYENAEGSSTSAVAAESLERALEIASRPDVFVMGGGMIYRQAIDIADRMFVTHVHTLVPDADTFFPVIDPEVWQLYERSNTTEDPCCGLKYEFRTYLRRTSDE